MDKLTTKLFRGVLILFGLFLIISIGSSFEEEKPVRVEIKRRPVMVPYQGNIGRTSNPF